MDPFSLNISPVPDGFLDDEKTPPDLPKKPNVCSSIWRSDRSSVNTRRQWLCPRDVAIACLLVGLAFCMTEATTLCQLALAACHLSRFLCDLPTAFQPPPIFRMCEWIPQFYDGNSFINMKCHLESSTIVATEAHNTTPTLPYMHPIEDASWPSNAPNRAALQHGAVVIPYFTSPTYNLTDPPLYVHALQKYIGFFVHRPSVVRSISVLDEENEPGDCWKFTSGGKIGIRFADRVNISAIALNKISAHLISEEARLQAPNVVVAWGLIRSLDDLADSAAGDTAIIRKSTSLASSSSGRGSPSDIPTSAYFIQMAKFRYSTQSSGSWQYQAINVGIPVDVLVLEFGAAVDASITCVHTISVHGDVVDW